MNRASTERRHFPDRELLDRIVQHAPVAIAVMKAPDLEYTMVNPAYQAIVGSNSDLIGRRYREVFPEAAARGAEAGLLEVLRSGQAWRVRDFETEIPGRDGLTWWDGECLPLPDATGKPDAVLVITWEVTEHKRVDQVVRESEERFRMLADNMAQLAWTCDVLGNVTWYNKRWLDYTGLTFEEMRGWDWSKVQHPDHLERVVARVKRSAETGEAWEDTFPLRGRDGSYRWFLSRAIPIRDYAGTVVLWFGTNTDVTDLRDAQQALRESDRAKDEFLATLSHELRNPLAPLRNSLHLLRLSGASESAAPVYEMMERQVDHLVRMVDDLLEVSRITRGAFALRREEVELAAIVRSAIETADPLIRAAGHDLSVSLPQEPLWIKGDVVRVAQILVNLLNNAAKYTERGGRIAVSARGDAGTATISVRDNGVGISPAQIARLFEMFTRGERSSGLGIGLAVARRLAEMHGGTLEAASEGPGRGAEFTVRLPMTKPTGVERSGHRVAPPSLSRKRVLVVDDNRDAADSLAMLLTFLGADVQVAHDGPAAIAAFHAYRPTIVLLDIGMPGMDGYQVARALRAHADRPSVPIVALTGWGQEEDRRRTREAGFDHHLIKPADIGALQSLLASLVPS